jgi:hypothetical protein
MMTEVEEREALCLSGWVALVLWIGAMAWAVWSLGTSIVHQRGALPLYSILAIPLLMFLSKGFAVLEPNLASVLTFFGRYAGTIRGDGFFYYNPLCKQRRISLRANNLNTPTLKVNDRAGNPIEVAAVIVWRVMDSARATFDVEDYVAYVTMQSESAVRQVVSTRWYDGDSDGRHSECKCSIERRGFAHGGRGRQRDGRAVSRCRPDRSVRAGCGEGSACPHRSNDRLELGGRSAGNQ